MTKRKNPETSNEAYRQLKHERVRETYQKILFALSIIKEGNFEDISKQAGLKPEVVWKRLSELHADGKIYRPGNKKPLRSGRLGYTWMLIQPGIAPAKVVEMALPGKTISDYSKELIQQKLF